MSKIDPEKQLGITHQILTEILDTYSIHDFTFEIFPLGIANTSIKIITKQKSYVLRIYAKGRKSDEDIQTEIVFQDYLREKGIPIPLIYKNTNEKTLTHIEIGKDKWQIVLMEYMDGTHKGEYSEEVLIQLAHIQAKMHLLGIDFAKSIKNHNQELTEMWDTMWPTKQEVETLEDIDQNTKEFLKRARTMHIKINPLLPHGYNHLDLDIEGNILIENNHIVAILDFDDVSYSACIICLGYTLWHVLVITNDWEKVHFYLAEYKKVRPLSEEELKTLPEIILFRNYVLGIIEYSLFKNYDRVKRIVSLEKSILQTKFYTNDFQ